MTTGSGVGVLDKAAAILNALENGPTSLSQLVELTEISRPTVHRIAQSLVHHGLVGRDMHGRFELGNRLVELASAAGEDRLVSAAGPVLIKLRDLTGESTQIFPQARRLPRVHRQRRAPNRPARHHSGGNPAVNEGRFGSPDPSRVGR